MRRRLALAAAVLVALGACGGGDGAADGAAEPVAADAEAFLQDLVNQAGAAAQIEGCADLDTPVRGAKAGAGDGAGTTLPDLTFPCLGGGDPVTLGDMRGPMVLNVWASWCGPCKDELPYLIAAKQEYGEAVRFAAVALADVEQESRQWMSFHGVTWPSLTDREGKIRGPLRIPGPPVTLFVRSDGTVAETHYGAFTSARQVTDAIAKHLGV